MVNSPGRQLLEASSAHAITASACKSSTSTAVLEIFRHTGPKTPVLQRFTLCFAKALMKCQSGWKNTEMKKCIHLLTPFTSEVNTINDVSKSMTWAGHSFGFTGAKQLKVNVVAHIKINTNQQIIFQKPGVGKEKTAEHVQKQLGLRHQCSQTCRNEKFNGQAHQQTLKLCYMPWRQHLSKNWRLILTFQELVYMGHW